jgi:hypothetical protein
VREGEKDRGRERQRRRKTERECVCVFVCVFLCVCVCVLERVRSWTLSLAYCTAPLSTKLDRTLPQRHLRTSTKPPTLQTETLMSEF